MPAPTASNVSPAALNRSTNADNSLVIPGPVTPCTETPIVEMSSAVSNVSVESVMPFPKAGARKNERQRNRQTSRILTDTPVREQLRERQEAKDLKDAKKRTNMTVSARKKLVMENMAAQKTQKPNKTTQVQGAKKSKPKASPSTASSRHREIRKPKPLAKQGGLPRKPEWLKNTSKNRELLNSVTILMPLGHTSLGFRPSSLTTATSNAQLSLL